MKCSECIYYNAQRCQRYPPVAVNSNGVSSFPRADFDDWCGEFKAKGVRESEPHEGLPY